MSSKSKALCMPCWNLVFPQHAVTDPEKREMYWRNEHEEELCDVCQRCKHHGIFVRMSTEQLTEARKLWDGQQHTSNS